MVNNFFVPDLSPMTTARKATPSEDPVECGGTSPFGEACENGCFFLSYQYVFQILGVAGALTHDFFMTISFTQGEGPHVQLPTALLRY